MSNSESILYGIESNIKSKRFQDIFSPIDQEQVSSEEDSVPSVENAVSGEEDSVPSVENTCSTQQQTHLNGVSTDQERQILLLMLLAQVCALHDPTPRTFTVHVLELFERGILGRQSIHFLFDLGLVPSSTKMALPPSSSSQSSLESNPTLIVATNDVTAEEGCISTDLATVEPLSPKTMSILRSREASAIRSHLEEQERTAAAGISSKDKGELPSSARISDTGSWSAEQHPLSLSRFEREFDKIGLLNSGSFGDVFQARNIMDGRNYAIKMVPFSASGYSTESLVQVTREVQCLAQCDHPNVVRYYTSWLEPSWMTGSGANMVTSDQMVNKKVQQKLLTDIEQMVATGEQPKSITPIQERGKMQSYFQNRRPEKRSYSCGDEFESFVEDRWGDSDSSECSEWSINNKARDDSYLYEKSHTGNNEGRNWGKANNKRKPSAHYQYQICLFIQTELCQPSTLGTWIRERNQKLAGSQQNLDIVSNIFSQIVNGLNHVHTQGIIHRDLKPANIFAEFDKEFQFKIGDFGLSKIINCTTNNESESESARFADGYNYWSSFPTNSLIESEAYVSPIRNDKKDDKNTWNDPLTAGVGTASYAAPEQIASSRYGGEADIFSLGLILLELFSCFTTEHERIQTFHDCRHRRDLPNNLKDNHPKIAQIILSCTDPDPSKRPSTKELMETSILNKKNVMEIQVGMHKELQKLRNQLLKKDDEVKRLSFIIKEKDQTIDNLRSEIKILSTSKILNICDGGGRSNGSFMKTAYDYGNEQLMVEEVASSSSSDDS